MKKSLVRPAGLSDGAWAYMKAHRALARPKKAKPWVKPTYVFPGSDVRPASLTDNQWAAVKLAQQTRG
jgi:hypothetical protein